MKYKPLATFISCCFILMLSASASVVPSAGGNDKIEIVITSQTTEADLERIAEQLKNEGIDFKVTNKNYKDGALTEIEFKIDAKGMNGNYSNNDIKASDKIYLVIDQTSNSLHIGGTPKPKCAGVCSSSCSKVI